MLESFRPNLVLYLTLSPSENTEAKWRMFPTYFSQTEQAGNTSSAISLQNMQQHR